MRVQLAAPRPAFAPMVLALVDAMAAAGAAVTDMAGESARASADTDLGRVQRALLVGGNSKDRPTLKGDGSLLVLEADTPVEAAELTASLARTLTLGDTTVVVNTESVVLDAALARQGLPTIGLATSSALRPHLQVLPLRLQLAFKPQDPFRAAELLLLPGGPLPGHARRSLLDALNEMPGVGSPKWLDAITEIQAEETVRAEGRGDSCPRKPRRLPRCCQSGLRTGSEVTCTIQCQGIPAARAADLCVLVSKWAGGRTGAQPSGPMRLTIPATSDDAQLWAQAAAVARTLEQMLLARPPGERLPQQTLMQLHDLATGNGSDLATFNQDAGRPAVARGPGEVIAPSPNVIWWGCTHDADQGPTPEPWTDAECSALRAAGVTLPVPGERREVESAEWRRPILAARQCAVLVRWRLAGAEPTPLRTPSSTSSSCGWPAEPSPRAPSLLNGC
jgi:ATP-dependent helicase/nuclease subunit B